jgi:hypothetical protein
MAAVSKKPRLPNKYERTKALRRTRAALGFLPLGQLSLDTVRGFPSFVLYPGWRPLFEEIWWACIEREAVLMWLYSPGDSIIAEVAPRPGSNVRKVVGRISDKALKICRNCGVQCGRPVCEKCGK